MIGAVENAMLARIAAASAAKAIRYAYATKESWPKLFDEYLSSEVVRYPACWAAYGGAHEVEKIGKGRWRAHCTFALVVAAENKRNEVSRRQGGSASEPGSYQMAEDALGLLANQTFGLDIDAFAPLSIQPVETADVPALKQISIYAVTFKAGLYYDTPAMPGDLNDFSTWHADWDPAPFGRVDPAALPDDGPAAAVDHIQFPPEEP